MPTPSGLPKRGEHLRAPDGGVWRVVQRHGNGEDYSLTLIPMTRPQAAQRAVRDHHVYGDPDGTMRLLEAAYWVGRGWTVLNDREEPTRLSEPPPAKEDNPRSEGWWQMGCWNSLSDAQQRRLIEVGNLPLGYKPEGTWCGSGAAVAVELEGDEAEGPRFYCLPCAVLYLAEQWKERGGYA